MNGTKLWHPVGTERYADPEIACLQYLNSYKCRTTCVYASPVHDIYSLGRTLTRLIEIARLALSLLFSLSLSLSHFTNPSPSLC